MIGEPDSPARQPTPRNLSAPVVANTRHTSSWSSVSTLTQNEPDWRIRGQLVELLAGGEADQWRIQRQADERLAGETDGLGAVHGR